MQATRSYNAEVFRAQPKDHHPAGASIAIIGAACRFPPNVESPDSFWDRLLDGYDFAADNSSNRLNLNGALGGRLDDPFSFDAAGFQISPREALQMDPQQRVFLEVAQDAFVDAGLTRKHLKGSRTGVIAGVYANDYLIMRGARSDTIDAHTAAGVSHAVVANRVSYVFDLVAPSFSVDSACSSGLLAVHLAMRLLRSGDADACLAGAVNLILDPLSQEITERVLTMAPDGRCKAFDARADGIVRSEGCVALVLKRLDDAVLHGDPIRAVILGSACNQDGRTNGLAAPNARAQQAVIRAALADAGLEPGRIDFIEAHGTGTPLGDPIEMSALGAIYGRGCTRPPLVGAVKANLGHTEAVSGLAGLLKAMMVVEHRLVPPQLHLHKVNASVEEARQGLRLSAEPSDIGAGRATTHAAVSAFGFSGTNVHVVLRAGTEAETKPTAAPPPLALVLPMSAPTLAALPQHVSDFAVALTRCGTEADAAELCRAAATRRDAHPYRTAITASDARSLASMAAKRRALPVADAVGAPILGFLFTGQTAQFGGMAAGLVARDAAFRKRVLEIDAMFVQAGDPDGPFSRLMSMPNGVAPPTDLAQGANFCLQVALTDWLRTANVMPAVVAGHSVGEVAAACVAGLLSLEDGVALIRTRSRLMRTLPRTGRMIVVRGPVDDFLEPALALPSVDLAAENDPNSIVVACSLADIPAVERLAAASGCRTSVLSTDLAFHSRVMDPLLDTMRNELADLHPGPPRLDMVSSVDPETLPAADATYWTMGLRKTVRFRGALEQMLAMGVEAFVEIGPHPVLTIFAKATSARSGSGVLAVPTLHRDRDDGESLSAALCALWERGTSVDWTAVLGRPTGRSTLPSVPRVEAQRHWDLAPLVQKSCETSVSAPPAISHPSSCDGSPLEEKVARHVADVIKAAGPVDRRTVLQALGFDSLLAVELKNRLEGAFRVTLPASLLLGSPTVVDIAHAVVSALDESCLDQLSDVEVEQLIAQIRG